MHNFVEHPCPSASRKGERGNILFMVLIAIVLIGLLTAVVSNTSNQSSSIDREELAIRVSEVQRYASELSRAMSYINQNSGISEQDYRFMNPDPAVTTYGDISGDSRMQRQILDGAGGGANYREPPEGIQNSDKDWEFYGTSNMPGVGTDAADLIAVLPDVTKQFCDEVNRLNGQTDQTPQDSGASCIYSGATGRFGTVGGSSEYAAAPNDLLADDAATFTKIPAMQACVKCNDDTYHFYHVLFAR